MDRTSFSKNDHPQQTIALMKTGGPQPGSDHCYLRSSSCFSRHHDPSTLCDRFMGAFRIHSSPRFDTSEIPQIEDTLNTNRTRILLLLCLGCFFGKYCQLNVLVFIFFSSMS